MSKELEQIQSQRLLRFSQLLWTVAKGQKANANDKGLVLFASLGLALQDEAHRKSLGSVEKTIVDALRAGTAPVDVPIGFSLAP